MKPLTYLLLPLLLVVLAACDLADSSDEATSPAGFARVAHDPDEEEISNNLAAPVIWGDDIPMALRGTFAETRLDGAYFKADGMPWYVQQDSLNEWQAQSAMATSEFGGDDFTVSSIDWKCNLETENQILGQRVRLRVVLYKILNEPMLAYTMRPEDPTAQGCDRAWGSNGVSFLTDMATVYSPAAHLVIQKLTKERDDPSLSVKWAGARWVGDVEPPVFSRGVWEAAEEHGGFKAKVNRQGEVMYHFNWETGMRSHWPSATYIGEGDYRLTIVLRDDAPTPLNTYFDEQTSIVVSDGHLVRTASSALIAPDTDHPGGVAEVQWQDNLTYIDVRLTGGN